LNRCHHPAFYRWMSTSVPRRHPSKRTAFSILSVCNPWARSSGRNSRDCGMSCPIWFFRVAYSQRGRQRPVQPSPPSNLAIGPGRHRCVSPATCNPICWRSPPPAAWIACAIRRSPRRNSMTRLMFAKPQQRCYAFASRELHAAPRLALPPADPGVDGVNLDDSR